VTEDITPMSDEEIERVTEAWEKEGTEQPDEEKPGLSLLRLWREVFSNVEAVREQKVAMGVAGRIVATWPQLKLQDVPAYHRRYHDVLLLLRDELDRVIEENPGAIDRLEDTDMEENFPLYKELVVSWNVLLDGLELEWDAAADDSHIEYAAVVDSRAFLFSRNGLAGHLEARGFDMDPDEIAQAIQSARGEL